jgi:predicted nucleotidyltransferase
VLTLFVMNPGRRFYCRQVARICGLSVAAVQEELKRLTEAGYLVSNPAGNKCYYGMNTACDVYPELLSMIIKRETVGPIIREWLPRLGKVDQAFIYGSYAKGNIGPYSDIDLLLVGEVDEDALTSLTRQLELSLSREVNYIVYGQPEFARLQREGDSFLARVLNGPRIQLPMVEVGQSAV